MHMDGGAAKITLLGTIIRSRIHTASQSLSFIIYLYVFFFFFFLLYQIKNSGRLSGET